MFQTNWQLLLVLYVCVAVCAGVEFTGVTITYLLFDFLSFIYFLVYRIKWRPALCLKAIHFRMLQTREKQNLIFEKL